MSIENSLSSLAQSELSRIVDFSPVAMAISRTDGSFEYVNKAFCTLFGYTEDECYRDNKVVTHEADMPTNQRIRERLLTNPENPVVIEKRYINKRGKVFLGLLSISALRDSNGDVKNFIAQVIDISYRKKLEKSAELFRTMINASRDSMFIIEPSTSKILDVNLQGYQCLGYSYEEALALLMINIEVQIESDLDWDNRVKELREYQYLLVSSDFLHKDGTIFPVEMSISYLIQEDFEYILVVVRDITERKKADELIWHQAHFDTLTNLPNRKMFYDRLDHAYKNSSLNQSRMAVLSVDLDKFKAVNDNFGHAIGDKLLIEVGKRLNACVRKSDTVARIGGDEFSILIDNVDEELRVDRIANSILKALSRVFVLDENRANISASIGIAFFPDDANSTDDLLKKSDVAMYAAKNNGRDCFEYYADSIR